MKKNTILYGLLTIVLISIVILETIYVVKYLDKDSCVCNIEESKCAIKGDVSNVEKQECTKKDVDILGVTKEEFSLISALINQESYKTYINLFNFMDLKSEYNRLSKETIKSPTFRMDQLVKVIPSTEHVASQDNYCDDEIVGCLKVPFTDFVQFVKSLSGASLTKEDLANWLHEEYIYTYSPTDAINNTYSFTIDSISKTNGKYNVVINDGIYKNEIVINSSLDELKVLNGIVESVK